MLPSHTPCHCPSISFPHSLSLSLTFPRPSPSACF
uniref:Uncharacterized protein n=1 Tax=Anguilla anguilla TaxID=7936 RepID=A0A0E9V8M2_ANGAN